MSGENYPSRKLTLDDIKPFLVNPKQRGQEIICACPLCESGDPKGHHLYIKNTNDDLVMYCQKDREPFQDLMRAFRDMGAEHKVEEVYQPKREIEKHVFEYRNPDGSLAYCKLRKKFSDGSKDFRAFYHDGDRTIWRFPDNCNALYNLDGMARALEYGDTPVLYIVEGEKCVDAMTEAGFVATSSNTGSQKKIKFSATDLEMLARFPVKIIIPDNDERGYEYVEAWQDVDVLPLPEIWPECPRKGDVADYFAAGGTVDKIIGWRNYRLDENSINALTRRDFIDADLFKALYRIKDRREQLKIQSLLEMKAQELKVASQFKRNWKAYLMQKAEERGSSLGRTTQFKNAPVEDQLDCGDWIADMAGVRRLVENENGQLDYDYATYTPLTVSGLLRNIENGMTKLAVSFWDEEMWKTVNVERKRLTNVNDILELANLNIDVDADKAKNLIKYISCLVNNNDSSKLPHRKSVSHLGWVDGKFIPYDDLISLDSGREHMDIVSALEEKGTFEEWVEFVRPLRKNIFMRMVLNASFASILLDKIEALPFILHLWGGTGSGKSVSLLVAASVWGNPTQGKLFKALNGTANYICQQLCFLKHLPFFGDELQTLKKDFNGYDNLIMRLTEGTNKGRLNRNSMIQDTPSWKNILITTGEEPCTQENSGGGTKNRVLEIQCTDTIVDDGHGVSLYIKSHYGTAGKRFIDLLDRYDLPAEYKAIQKSMLNLGSTQKQYMAMAALLLADKIVSEQIFNTPMLNNSEIADFLKIDAEVSKAERAYEAILGLIEEHNLKFSTYSNEAPNLCWGKISGNKAYFISTICKRELRNMGFEFDAVKDTWSKHGYIEKDLQGKYSKVEKIASGRANARCIIINLLPK